MKTLLKSSSQECRSGRLKLFLYSQKKHSTASLFKDADSNFSKDACIGDYDKLHKFNKVVISSISIRNNLDMRYILTLVHLTISACSFHVQFEAPINK